MSDTDRHTVTYEQAAQLLGVSVRTVQRRVSVGQLATVSDNGRQLVVLPGLSENPVLEKLTELPQSPELEKVVVPDPRLAALEARVAELEADRDMWRTMAARLSDTVTEQNRMLAAQMVQQRRMIDAETPQEPPEGTHRSETTRPRRRGLRDLYRAWRGR